MKAYTGSTDIAPLILNLGREGDECSASRPGRITPGKEPRYPNSRKLGETHSKCGRFGGDKNLPPLPRFEHQAFQPAA
jgi:hypothetical protein